mgnify:CR=1 FL=1
MAIILYMEPQAKNHPNCKSALAVPTPAPGMLVQAPHRQTCHTVIKDCTIVNETTNNYYNPATGQNYPIKDWSYDANIVVT